MVRRASGRRLLASQGPWSIGAAVAAMPVLALVLVAFQRRALAELFELSISGGPGPDAWLYPAALFSTSLVLLSPSVLVSAVLALARRPRASRAAFVSIASSTLLLAFLDLDLLGSVGRHLGEIAMLAVQPQGHIAGGSAWSWALVVLGWATMALLSTVLVTGLCQRLMVVARARLTALARKVLAAATATTLSMLAVAPVLLLDAWGPHPVVERLYASALFDIRPRRGGSENPANLEPRLRGLYERLLSSYQAAFPALTASKPGGTHALRLPARPPNVVLIITESFRHDAFGPELMPRLSRWARQGLVSAHHDAGTIYSQSGAFALLYGRSPAVYHQTLDAGAPPQFCTALRSAGYECWYFTGHPKKWMRREDFLNERTMDRFVHDDRGDWPEWDQRALDSMVEHVNGSDKPVFAIVLLMSSHFEYRYPAEYEIDRPVSNTTWLATMVSSLGPDAELPHRNRYRNCMRFIDDLVSDAIGRLDPERNLVIFTGDHGESINDDGRYTHGYSFAEILTRTPLAIVGPGIAPARWNEPTMHADVLPSVLHVLAGSSVSLEHAHGIDWFAGERHDSVLEAHSPPNKQVVETQLRVGGHRLRIDLDLTRPSIRLLGFEDKKGRLLPTPELSESEANQIVQAFRAQLSTLRR